jgi:uncharacterized protein (PEP-CTERM system associated)
MACASAACAQSPTPSDDATVRAQAEAAAGRRLTQTQRRPLTFVPSISAEETYTDNVNLQPAGSRRSDFVTQLVPELTISESGPRTSLAGSISTPILLYARTGSENDRVVPQASIFGTVAAVERLLFVDAAALVSQEYFTPFGGRSASIVNQPANQYTSQWYKVSPYLKAGSPGNLSYELRDDNIWTNATNAPTALGSSYTNHVLANVTREARPFGWALDYDRNDVRFSGQDSQVTQLGRARALWRPDVTLELSASGGYENNDFTLSNYNDTIYGAGVRWRPTERTSVDANWEHRFFGSSYRFLFDHRTRLSVASISASRDVTSYPQVLAQLPGGGIVPLLLDSLFASRIPDALQRQQFILAFMRDRGLPTILAGPFNLYLQQFYLEERANATTGLIGARNSVFVTVYRVRTQAISGSGESLPPLIDQLTNNTQLGGGVLWTHNLTPALTLATSADYQHTTANGSRPGTSNETSLRAVISTPLSANTTMHAGARYQNFRSDIAESFREVAAYVGLTHTFR